MEADTGRLTVTSSLDREKRDRYSLKVRAENVGRHRYGREISRSGKNICNASLLLFVSNRTCIYCNVDQTILWLIC